MMVLSRYPIDTPAFDLQSMTHIAKCNVQYRVYKGILRMSVLKQKYTYLTYSMYWFLG